MSSWVRYVMSVFASITIMMIVSCGGGGGGSGSDQFDSHELNDHSAQIQADVDAASLIFVGTITAVGAAPTMWSGIAWSNQGVTYAVDAVLKGGLDGSEVTAYHVLVEGSRQAAADAPGLSASIFTMGTKLIVFAKQNEDVVTLAGDDWEVPRYLVFDEDFGSIPWSSQNQSVIESMISQASASVTSGTDAPISEAMPPDVGKTLNINGAEADTQKFGELLAACTEKSQSLADLVSTLASTKEFTVDVNVVRDAENVFVDAFTGKKVDIDDLEKWHEGCNDKTELCQLFGHILAEYGHAAETGDGYDASHQKGLEMEGQIRQDLGKSTVNGNHTGLWRGEQLYMLTVYGGNAELVKIGGGNKPTPDTVEVEAVGPKAPTIQEADNTTSCQITVRWEDNADNEEGFEIQRRTGSTGEWILAHTVGPDTVGWTNTRTNAPPDLVFEQEYCYRVRAYRTYEGQTVYSEWSDIVCATKQ